MTDDDQIWIFGPCSAESREIYLETADELNEIFSDKDWYYKASFDKANRSSIEGARGPGLEETVEYFKEVKERYPNIKLTTDVHEPWQVEKIAPYIDLVQIPAFLCRQTDLLVEAGKHFDKVNMKKGQFASPDNIIHAVGKVKHKNEDAEVWITQRGTFFGYSQLTVDFSATSQLKRHFDKVILDTTHSTQYVDKEGFCKGDRDLAKKYALAAPFFGFDGIFAETHPNPEETKFDGTASIHLEDVSTLVSQCEKVLETNESIKTS